MVSFSSSVSSVTASSGISSGSRYRVCCRGDGEPKSSRTVMDHAMTATPMPRDSSKKSGNVNRHHKKFGSANLMESSQIAYSLKRVQAK